MAAGMLGPAAGVSQQRFEGALAGTWPGIKCGSPGAGLPGFDRARMRSHFLNILSKNDGLMFWSCENSPYLEDIFLSRLCAWFGGEGRVCDGAEGVGQAVADQASEPSHRWAGPGPCPTSGTLPPAQPPRSSLGPWHGPGIIALGRPLTAQCSLAWSAMQ